MSIIAVFCVMTTLRNAIILQVLVKLIEQDDMDLNVPNEEGDSPIHSIVRHKRKKRADLLLTLLVNGCSRIDVNQPSKLSKDTALHLAVTVCKTNTYDWMLCVSYSYMYVAYNGLMYIT